ncbi:targeting protein for Xklp2 [Crotalus adamanteus]|uniref:Targeting protein for Xklp2 n=1 Tax=Crotalus adamanteus TaxID=8729 RepID=A0AAW1BSI3_CROAD
MRHNRAFRAGRAHAQLAGNAQAINVKRMGRSRCFHENQRACPVEPLGQRRESGRAPPYSWLRSPRAPDYTSQQRPGRRGARQDGKGVSPPSLPPPACRCAQSEGGKARPASGDWLLWKRGRRLKSFNGGGPSGKLPRVTSDPPKSEALTREELGIAVPTEEEIITMSEDTYSYDVPDISLNFKEMNDAQKIDVDAWFVVRSAALMTPCTETGPPGVLPKALSFKSNLPWAAVSPMVKSDEKESNNEDEMEPSNEIPANVVRSMAEWPQATRENALPAGRPPARAAKRLSARRKSAQRRLMAKSHAEKVATALASKQEPPPVKKQKMSNTRENLTEIDTNRNVTPGKAQVPVTPGAPKTRGASMKGKSTEMLELEKMQKLQQEVVELRRKNEESLRVAIAGPDVS